MIESSRHGKFIAVANMKGGVGKTTTVVSLAERLAISEPGASILVVDLDPQASASICIAGDGDLTTLIQQGRTIDAFLALKLIKHQNADLSKRVRRHCSTTTIDRNPVYLALLPCGPDLRLVERELLHALVKEKFDMRDIELQLAELFESDFRPLAKEFNYIIFDCAPGISPLTEVAIKASDLIIIPSIPDRISAYGLKGFCQMLAEESSGMPKPPKKPYVLLTRVQSNVRQHKEMIDDLLSRSIGEDADFHVFDTQIPQSAALADALMVDGIPTINRKYGAAINQVMQKFVHEVRQAL